VQDGTILERSRVEAVPPPVRMTLAPRRRSASAATADVDDETRAAHRRVLATAENHGTTLQGFARRLGLGPEQAEDAAQEVFLRLYRAMLSGDDIHDARAWSFRAMYRLAMDEHRLRLRVHRLRERLSRGLLPEPVMEPDVASRLSIWAAVDRLPGRQRQVLYLRYRADMTFEDVASVLGITAGGDRAIAAMATDRLRVLMTAGEDAG
jgi:RNA polymerase sigma factor (sigma-70 family)